MATETKGLPQTLRDAGKRRAASALQDASRSADSVIERQSTLAANSDINGEDDAKRATDAVEAAVAQASKEADASQAEVVQSMQALPPGALFTSLPLPHYLSTSLPLFLPSLASRPFLPNTPASISARQASRGPTALTRLESQATQQAAADEAAAMASATAKGISDEVMATAEREAANAQDAASDGG